MTGAQNQNVFCVTFTLLYIQQKLANLAKLLRLADSTVTYNTTRAYKPVKSCAQIFSKINKSSESFQLGHVPLREIQAEMFSKKSDSSFLCRKVYHTLNVTVTE